ncbi:MAG: hypothetical protein GC129_03800 [Proteobacteria bacterium]|nr:hypothetical protein [Pseudomonadota bacterium]
MNTNLDTLSVKQLLRLRETAERNCRNTNAEVCKAAEQCLADVQSALKAKLTATTQAGDRATAAVIASCASTLLEEVASRDVGIAPLADAAKAYHQPPAGMAGKTLAKTA